MILTGACIRITWKAQIAGLHPAVSDLVGPGWVLIICISNKFPGYADAAGPGTMLQELLV